MDEQRQLFGTRAETCITELQALKQTTTLPRPIRPSATRRFLIGVAQDVNDSLQSLQTWNTEFAKQSLTERNNVVEGVARLFDSLDVSIGSARHNLRSRLRYRRRYLIGFLPGKRHASEESVTRALKVVLNNIEQLQAQNKILLGTSAKQALPPSKKRLLLEGRTQSSNAFSDLFNNLQAINPQDVRSYALDMLWRFFPEPRVPDRVVGNAEDPGDGYLYDEKEVDRVKAILQHLHQAWCSIEHSSICPAPPELPNMAKICLVLRGMQRRDLLKDFLDKKVLDDHLPMERDKIEEVLAKENQEYAAIFSTEQYRAVTRTWEEGHHLEIEEEEPLPLEIVMEYNEGSYGKVVMVKDSLTGAFYARKQQRTSAEAQENAAYRKHLKEETERLKNLRHNHVVQLVKTYQRGRVYAMILKPAATTDLERLILRYPGNKFDPTYQCKTREWLAPILMYAFGCLSKGLAYIHSHNIRHKDIKPANILYEKALDNHGPRLLWADFGLAYDFSATGNSRTRNTRVYSQRYAAPEIVASRTKLVPERTANVRPDLDRIVECVEEMVVDAEIESEFRETEENGHGRMTDIFSLGCVFLELLACLLNEKLPMDRKDAEDPKQPPRNTKHLPQDVKMFSQHLPELTNWAQRHIGSDSDGKLNPLLGLAIKMISLQPKDRPTVADVVRDVALAGSWHFCDGCRKDHEGEQALEPTVGPPQASVGVESSLPKVPREDQLEKAKPISRRGSIGLVLARVNSGTRSQLPRFLSSPTLKEVG
ncbi:MAG: hypothetical protein Q9178_006264 [Gyalolechia marmorata]